MAAKISTQQMAQYKQTALKWQQQEQTKREQRRELAWQLAREAAALLKEGFHAEQVVLFGSLIQADRFTNYSDVDLAAWGLTSDNWLKAMDAVRNLSDEIELNLVDITCCSPQLRKAVEQEGVPL